MNETFPSLNKKMSRLRTGKCNYAGCFYESKTRPLRVWETIILKDFENWLLRNISGKTVEVRREWEWLYDGEYCWHNIIRV